LTKAHLIATKAALLTAKAHRLTTTACSAATSHDYTFLNGFTFCLILAGCGTNCLPAALPARLALVVAAYSAGDNAFIAFSGK
jgi:hypothetical protein